MPDNDKIRILAVSVAEENPELSQVQPLYDMLNRTEPTMSKLQKEERFRLPHALGGMRALLNAAKNVLFGGGASERCDKPGWDGERGPQGLKPSS